MGSLSGMHNCAHKFSFACRVDRHDKQAFTPSPNTLGNILEEITPVAVQQRLHCFMVILVRARDLDQSTMCWCLVTLAIVSNEYNQRLPRMAMEADSAGKAEF